MISQAKILLCFILVIALVSARVATMTKERLVEEREKKVVHLQHAMEQIKKQLDGHNSGVKNLDERRLKSLKNRLQSYKGQIYDATRVLSPEEIEDLIGGSGTEL